MLILLPTEVVLTPKSCDSGEVEDAAGVSTNSKSSSGSDAPGFLLADMADERVDVNGQRR